MPNKLDKDIKNDIDYLKESYESNLIHKSDVSIPDNENIHIPNELQQYDNENIVNKKLEKKAIFMFITR